MRNILSMLIVAILFLACTPQGKDELTRAEVDELADRWLTLWSTYDVDMLNDIFWNDPGMTYFSSEKRGLIKGYDQMKPHHEGFGFVAGGKQPPNSLWLEDINTSMHNDFATIEAIWYFGDKSLPKDSIQNGPVTFVIFKNKDGSARIAHTHFSNYE